MPMCSSPASCLCQTSSQPPTAAATTTTASPNCHAPAGIQMTLSVCVCVCFELPWFEPISLSLHMKRWAHTGRRQAAKHQG